MPTLQERTLAAVSQLEADTQLQHELVSGGPTDTVTTEGGQVRTVANAIATLMATVPRGAWSATPTPSTYSTKDLVTQGGLVYICTLNHTPGVFVTDLAAGKWALFSGPADDGSIASGFGHQRRRGTAAQNDAFTGLAGEFTVDSDTKDIRLHDGVTVGGHKLRTKVNVRAFGAKGDGVTDDTAAIRAALTYAASLRQLLVTAQIQTQIVVWFSSGTYYITGALDNGTLSDCICYDGELAIIKCSSTAFDAITMGYNTSVHNLFFVSGNRAITVKVHTEENRLNIFNCKFSNQATASVGIVDVGVGNASESYVLSIVRCQVYNDTSAGRAFDLLSGDQITVRDCWITCKDAFSAVRVGGASNSYACVNIDNCLFAHIAPTVATDQFHVENYGKVNVRGCRLGTEGSRKTIIQRGTNANYSTFSFHNNFFSQVPWIELEKLPAFAEWTSNPITAGLYLHINVTSTEAAPAPFPFKLDTTNTIWTGSTNYAQLIEAMGGNKTGDFAPPRAYPLLTDVVLSQTQSNIGSATGSGLAHGATNSANLTAAGEYGYTFDLSTCSAPQDEGDRWRTYYVFTATMPTTGKPYTAYLKIRVANANSPVTVEYNIQNNGKTFAVAKVVTNGTHWIEVPFYAEVATTSISYYVRNAEASGNVYIDRFVVVKGIGYRLPSANGLILVSATAPAVPSNWSVVQLYKGDRAMQTFTDYGAPQGWECYSADTSATYLYYFRPLPGTSAAVTAPSGGSTVDTECRAQLSDLITKMQAAGIMHA